MILFFMLDDLLKKIKNIDYFYYHFLLYKIIVNSLETIFDKYFII